MIYPFSCSVFKLMYLITGGLKCVGTENIPDTGGVILAPNHISLVDPPAVGCKLKRPVRFMAKEELFKVPILGPWMRAGGTFPVRRGTADRKAIKHAIDLLQSGEMVCIFPEGTRSPDGNLQEPELGIGLIALKSRSPIVPVAIFNSDRVLPAHSKRIHRDVITVVYGKPLTFPELYEAKESREAMETIGKAVMAAIGELRSSYRG